MRNSLVLGLLLFALTMLTFFIVYYFFGGSNFYMASLNTNAFILPVLYCGVAFISVRSLWKRQSINFKEAFRRAFIPMFTGGFLSMMTIYLFINFADPGAKNLLNYQFVQKNKTELTEIYHKERARLKTEKEKQDLEKDYQKSLQSFSPEQVKNIDMFSFSHFSAYFGAIFIFYVVISAFFGAFFRSRSPH